MTEAEAIAALTALPGVSRITTVDLAPGRQNAAVVEFNGTVAAADARAILDTLKELWPDRLVHWAPVPQTD